MVSGPATAHESERETTLDALEYEINRNRRKEQLLLSELKQKSEEFSDIFGRTQTLEKELSRLAENRQLYRLSKGLWFRLAALFCVTKTSYLVGFWFKENVCHPIPLSRWGPSQSSSPLIVLQFVPKCRAGFIILAT